MNTKAAEESIIERLRKHGVAELSAQFVTLAPSLYRLIAFRGTGILSARLDPSDICQEAYLEASRRLEKYLENPAIPFKAWVRQITRQVLARQHRNHIDVQKRSLLKEESIPENASAGLGQLSIAFARFVDSITSPGSKLVRKEVCAEVRRILQQLSPLEREVLCLKQLEGLTTAEIAEELDVSISTVKRKIFKAITRFRTLAAFLEG